MGWGPPGQSDLPAPLVGLGGGQSPPNPPLTRLGRAASPPTVPPLPQGGELQGHLQEAHRAAGQQVVTLGCGPSFSRSLPHLCCPLFFVFVAFLSPRTSFDCFIQQLRPTRHKDFWLIVVNQGSSGESQNAAQDVVAVPMVQCDGHGHAASGPLPCDFLSSCRHLPFVYLFFPTEGQL